MDHNYEQMWPTNTAGKNYILWSMSPPYNIGAAPNPNGYDTYKLIGLDNGTTITRKIGAATTTITLNKNQSSSTYYTPSYLTSNPYVNNSTGIIELTSDKPFLVEHILGHAPCIKWISPIEQRVTSAILTPFIPVTGSSVIDTHRLHVLIPVGSIGNMVMKETRNGVTQNVALTFYTNTTNPNYVIAWKGYSATDDVLIELSNPSGLIAYMAGYGTAESYIFTAGAGAFNLQNYYTITTKTTPLNDTYYTETEEATHSFNPADNITLKRTIEKPFTQVTWLVDRASYTVTEKTNTSNTVTIPASALVSGNACGSHTIAMSVRYSGATADSVYTGTVWLNIPPAISATATSACSASPTTFTATVSSGSTTAMTYTWEIAGATYSTTTNPYSSVLTGTSTYSVHVKTANGCTAYTPPQTATVTSSAGATPTISISASTNNVCYGTVVNYSSTVTNQGTTPGYQWRIDGNPVIGATASTYSYTPDNGEIVTCVLTSDMPCASPNQVTSTGVTMTILPAVTPAVTITGAPD
jgi:hypothetical protein